MSERPCNQCGIYKEVDCSGTCYECTTNRYYNKTNKVEANKVEKLNWIKFNEDIIKQNEINKKNKTLDEIIRFIKGEIDGETQMFEYKEIELDNRMYDNMRWVFDELQTIFNEYNYSIELISGNRTNPEKICVIEGK